MENRDAGDRKNEIRFRSSNGSIIPTALSVTWVGESNALCVVATDLSLQKRIEEHLRSEFESSQEALRASENQLNEILEKIDGGFITYDRDWRFTLVNTVPPRMSDIHRPICWGRMSGRYFPR